MFTVMHGYCILTVSVHFFTKIFKHLRFVLCFYYVYMHLTVHFNKYTIMILSFRTDRSGQTVQTQIRLLLEEQSDQGLHCFNSIYFFGCITIG